VRRVRGTVAPKIATLARLASAGLPVPAFVALADTSEPDLATWSRIDDLLHAGPVIVRAALPGEDTAEAAGAGLGSSIADCRDRDAVRAALHHIADALHDPWLASYFSGPPAAQVLVQSEIRGPWLAVVAQARLRFAELHRREPRPDSEPRTTRHTEPLMGETRSARPHSEPFIGESPTERPLAESQTGESRTARPDAGPSIGEPLAAGLTPALAGPLALFPAELRDPITCLCDQVTAALPAATHGLDLELVADHTGAVWVVQARPLTRPLHAEWPAFAAAARRDLDAGDADRLPLPGLWHLDAEHNPAPLSPAHAGVIRRLAPDGTRVLAGWLYVAGRLTSDTRPADEPELRTALHALQARHIPGARAALDEFTTSLTTTDRAAIVPLIDHACTQLKNVLAIYATLPARPRDLDPDPRAPLCLHDRGAHLDVLPASWDIASPTLHDLSPGPRRPGRTSHAAPVHRDPSPEALATLIGELDDHLFALGLAPLRRVYLRAAELLSIPASDIFLLTPDELQAALRGSTIDLAARRREHEQQAGLFPPLQLYDGLPVPSPTGAWLRGVPIGPAAEGPLHQRRDLAHLLADPPPPGAVLAIPALTAQAAVVLRDLGVRAVCCEHGGALSHAALMARELGLSALIGCRGCTTIAARTHVRLDTRTGRLRIRPT
jgi:hypothetical protein